MTNPKATPHNDRFIFVLVLLALAALWLVVAGFTLVERDYVLERARTQLENTVITLADFNELAYLDVDGLAQTSSEARTAALWRALLQYPEASIWVEGDSGITGNRPAGERRDSLVVEERREDFSVHAALPRAAALSEWRRATWQRGLLLLAVTAAFLLLTHVLVRTLRARGAAELQATAVQERNRQLSLYRSQLEQTVEERTRELQAVNQRLQAELAVRKEAEEKVATLARTDALTGLANRATFIERLHQAFAAAQRGASHFAVLYLDLDHFKTINDTLGHPVGDQLLQHVGRRLRDCCRETDLVARLGGDEFAILQMNLNEAANAGTLAENILKALTRPYQLGENELHITTSIGICPYSPQSSGADSMLGQADLALYRAKAEGRNQYRFHSSDLDREVMERATLAEDLREAIERGGLELVFRPRRSLRDETVEGMEALLQWRHPRRGVLQAEEFVPIAEKTGNSMALGRWVLDEACRQLRAWYDQDAELPRITLALSALQLKNAKELLQDIRAATARWNLNPGHLEFSVTEAMMAQTALAGNDALLRLRMLGCGIIINHFGGDYSSFDFLRTYSVSHLKIDRAFLQRALSDPQWAAIIHAIVHLAADLGICIVAQDTANSAERQLLVTLGDEAGAEGFFSGAPVDGSTAARLLGGAGRSSEAVGSEGQEPTPVPSDEAPQ